MAGLHVLDLGIGRGLMRASDRHWLAGLLEGEGSFVAGPPSRPNAPQIALQMCDEDVVERVSALLGTRYYECRARKLHHKVSWGVHLRGERAVHLMLKLRPLLGQRRREQIDRAIASHAPDPRHWSKRKRPTTKQMLVLRKKKWSYRRIAKQLGCSHQLVAKRLGS